MMHLLFPKRLRLLNSSHFSYVFKKPFKISNKELIILSRMNKLRHPRVGLLIKRKKIKKSCERNRIKRIIRETFRLSQNRLISMDYIVIVKNTDILLYTNMMLIKKLEDLWSRYYQNF